VNLRAMKIYMCGCCRREYSEFTPAYDCHRDHVLRFYRCCICKRKYDSLDIAYDCCKKGEKERW